MNPEESATPERRKTTALRARRARSGGARRSKHEIAPAFEAGTVTALAALDTRGARFTLEIEGVSGIASAELIGDYKLAVGRAIDSTAAALLTAAVRRLAVFDHAVAILARRPRSERDLRVRLRRTGASDADVSAAISQLQKLGLQNDATYARHVAESRAAGGRVSKRRVEQELRRKGVATDVASAAVSEALGDVGIDEETAALEAARKRARSLRNLEPTVARRRLYAFLARRGFDSNLVARVVRTALDAPEDD